ncbi:hypothetical protein CEXT_656991 [Caerostris extrusa]|uniref:Uncharacterized protein n=1 Tax=Caerostris extrusa TaxID=172846 RepID=A0AAV4M817_CAEEX|nr:hypothetical protein CEXT_656991 [Caerostris extrusa]
MPSATKDGGDKGKKVFFLSSSMLEMKEMIVSPSADNATRLHYDNDVALFSLLSAIQRDSSFGVVFTNSEAAFFFDFSSLSANISSNRGRKCTRPFKNYPKKSRSREMRTSREHKQIAKRSKTNGRNSRPTFSESVASAIREARKSRTAPKKNGRKREREPIHAMMMIIAATAIWEREGGGRHVGMLHKKHLRKLPVRKGDCLLSIKKRYPTKETIQRFSLFEHALKIISYYSTLTYTLSRRPLPWAPFEIIKSGKNHWERSSRCL